MPTTCLVVYFDDNNRHKAETRFWFPNGAVTSDGAIAGSGGIISALSAISSARITHYETRINSDRISGDAPAPASDCFRRLSLFYRNGTSIGSLTVPSWTGLPVDTDGPYQFIRVTRDAAILSGVLANLEALVANTVTKEGEPFPGNFVVGGTSGGEL
jgi:hypothetical protein